MPDPDFDGTEVLERLAAIGRLDEFSNAVDTDDTALAAELMRSAGIDALTIESVLSQMRGEDE